MHGWPMLTHVLADSALVVGARAVAVEHARASDVEVRTLHTHEAPDASDLLAQIWAPRAGRVPLEASLLVALLHSDNYVAGAFQDARLIGVCVGFFTAPTESSLHSHIAGVRTSYVGRGVGAALKLHQRAWGLAHGVTSITWTFDPLVARNAYFNLERLGARGVEYVTDFYGAMSDGVNDGQGSDRLVACWDLTAWPPIHHSDDPVPPALELGRVREPVLLAVPADATGCRVAVPDDIEVLRRTDPGLAAEWRRMTREVFTDLSRKGWHITGFDRSGFYRLHRAQPGGPVS